MWDPARPWNFTLHELIADERFWKREVEEPGTHILNGLGNRDGEDNTAVASGLKRPLIDQATREPRLRKAPKIWQKDRAHPQGGGGGGRNSNLNKRGVEICNAFNRHHGCQYSQ